MQPTHLDIINSYAGIQIKALEQSQEAGKSLMLKRQMQAFALSAGILKQQILSFAPIVKNEQIKQQQSAKKPSFPTYNHDGSLEAKTPIYTPSGSFLAGFEQLQSARFDFWAMFASFSAYQQQPNIIPIVYLNGEPKIKLGLSAYYTISPDLAQMVEAANIGNSWVYCDSLMIECGFLYLSNCCFDGQSAAPGKALQLLILDKNNPQGLKCWYNPKTAKPVPHNPKQDFSYFYQQIDPDERRQRAVLALGFEPAHF